VERECGKKKYKGKICKCGLVDVEKMWICVKSQELVGFVEMRVWKQM